MDKYNVGLFVKRESFPQMVFMFAEVMQRKKDRYRPLRGLRQRTDQLKRHAFLQNKLMRIGMETKNQFSIDSSGTAIVHPCLDRCWRKNIRAKVL